METARRALKQAQSEMADHDVNEAGLDAVFDAYVESLTAYNEEIVDLGFQLRDQLSRDEWNALFGDIAE